MSKIALSHSGALSLLDVDWKTKSLDGKVPVASAHYFTRLSTLYNQDLELHLLIKNQSTLLSQTSALCSQWYFWNSGLRRSSPWCWLSSHLDHSASLISLSLWGSLPIIWYCPNAKYATRRPCIMDHSEIWNIYDFLNVNVWAEESCNITKSW